jgi:hypothetical protein
MFDEQDRHIRGEAGEARQDFMPIGLRHAGGRFVEQQHFRAAGDGERDFEQPLLAVGQALAWCADYFFENEICDQRSDFILDAGNPARMAEPVAAASFPLADHQSKALDDVEPGKQLIDLEGPDKTTAHAPLAAKAGDVLVVERDATR